MVAQTVLRMCVCELSSHPFWTLAYTMVHLKVKKSTGASAGGHTAGRKINTHSFAWIAVFWYVCVRAVIPSVLDASLHLKVSAGAGSHSKSKTNQRRNFIVCFTGCFFFFFPFFRVSRVTPFFFLISFHGSFLSFLLLFHTIFIYFDFFIFTGCFFYIFNSLFFSSFFFYFFFLRRSFFFSRLFLLLRNRNAYRWSWLLRFFALQPACRFLPPPAQKSKQREVGNADDCSLVALMVLMFTSWSRTGTGEE